MSASFRFERLLLIGAQRSCGVGYARDGRNRQQIVGARGADQQKRCRQETPSHARIMRTDANQGCAGAGGGVGAAGAGLLKSTVGAVEIAFSFSTLKFAFVL